MNIATDIIVEIIVAACLALGIPVAVIYYNRTQDREPSDREKRILLIGLSIGWFISSFFVDNPWGLFNDSYIVFRPFTGGTTIGLGILLLWYVESYGWSKSEEEPIQNNNQSE